MPIKRIAGRSFSLILLIISGLVNLPSVYGQTDTVFSFPVNDENQGEVESLLAGMSSWEVMTGTFSQDKEIARLNRIFSSSGSFIFSGDNGVIWSVLEPFPSETILTDRAIIQRNPQGGSSIIDTSENAIFSSFSSAILAVFSGDFRSLEKHFHLFFINDGDTGIIGLVPRDATVSIIIDNLILRGSDDLQSLIMTEAGGDSVVYTFEMTGKREALSPNEEKLFSY